MVVPKRRRPLRAVDAAADTLRSAIIASGEPTGTKLPPERVLAERLGISRLTLRAALARLEAEGLVRVLHGSGIEMQHYLDSAGLEVLPYLAELSHSAEGAIELVESLLELRRIIAAEAVALGCQRATEQDLKLLERLATEQRLEPDPVAFQERDIVFARVVIQAAGSTAMQLLLNTVEKIYRTHPMLTGAVPQFKEAACLGYEAVVGMLKSGRPDEARTAVRAALEQLDRELLQVLRSDEKHEPDWTVVLGDEGEPDLLRHADSGATNQSIAGGWGAPAASGTARRGRSKSKKEEAR